MKKTKWRHLLKLAFKKLFTYFVRNCLRVYTKLNHSSLKSNRLSLSLSLSLHNKTTEKQEGSLRFETNALTLDPIKYDGGFILFSFEN
jgi:hypothetical protein